MSISRNFYMGREVTKGVGSMRRLDWKHMNETARAEMAEMGIDIRDARQVVGTLSGANGSAWQLPRRAFRRETAHPGRTDFRARRAPGIRRVAHHRPRRARGLAVIFITHNIHHAYPIGDRFTLLNRSGSLGTFTKEAISREALADMMAGGTEMVSLEEELRQIQAA